MEITLFLCATVLFAAIALVTRRENENEARYLDEKFIVEFPDGQKGFLTERMPLPGGFNFKVALLTDDLMPVKNAFGNFVCVLKNFDDFKIVAVSKINQNGTIG